MRREAAWAESVVDCRSLERVREATGLSDVEARDRVQVATRSWGGERGDGTLGPLGGEDVVSWEWDRRSGE